jgi:Tfp pilus assembly protein PilV
MSDDMPSRSAIRSEDLGETLIEVLVALVILAVGVTAIMTALATTVHTGSFNRTQGKANAVLSAASEYVRSQPYYSCAAQTTTTLTNTQVPQDTGYTVTVEGPENLPTVTAPTNPWTSPAINCTSGIETMKITVAVIGDTGITASQYVSLYCHKPMVGSTCPS